MRFKRLQLALALIAGAFIGYLAANANVGEDAHAATPNTQAVFPNNLGNERNRFHTKKVPEIYVGITLEFVLEINKVIPNFKGANSAVCPRVPSGNKTTFSPSRSSCCIILNTEISVTPPETGCVFSRRINPPNHHDLNKLSLARKCTASGQEIESTGGS